MRRMPRFPLSAIAVTCSIALCGFTTAFLEFHSPILRTSSLGSSHNARPGSSSSALYFFQDQRSEAEIEEEVRLNVLESRRYHIRTMLKSAEAVRNLRIQNGW